jgi:hypothetical protein
MLYLLLQKKKCKSCGKLSHKDVLYCWFCGCSFNKRICVSGHQNPSWVQHCRTCGKDRSLMSRPHSTKELHFSRHPKKPNTYVPSHSKTAHTLAWLAIGFGIATLCVLALAVVAR